MTDLEALHTGIDGFSTLANITAVTLTDNGGGDGSVDFGTLETIVDNYQTDVNANVAFSFQAEDTIGIDTTDELSAFVEDIGDNALVLVNQDVTIDSEVDVSVADAKTIAADTAGTVTATITSGTRVASLTELRTPDGVNAEAHSWTITIHNDDATLATAADLNTINDATTEQVNASEVTTISSSTISAVGTLLTSAVADTPREFTTGSFDNLGSLTISDDTIDVDSLNLSLIHI